MNQYERRFFEDIHKLVKIQEEILKHVSKGNNIFMVGDVKQSIYKFRQARPELFLQKYDCGVCLQLNSRFLLSI